MEAIIQLTVWEAGYVRLIEMARSCGGIFQGAPQFVREDKLDWPTPEPRTCQILVRIITV